MTSFSEMLENIQTSDPAFLAGDDKYVLDCRNCPAHLPGAFLTLRLVCMLEGVSRLMKRQEEEGANVIIEKLAEWVGELEPDAPEVSDDAKAILMNRDGLWKVGVTEGLGQLLKESGVDPKAFITSFNDQNGAQLSEELGTIVKHNRLSHPGVVSCGGTVEAGGRMLCGASVETVQCAEDDPSLIGDVILASVQNNIQ